MFKQNEVSIYKQFYRKLIFATSLFIIAISFIFYGYTKATIYEDIQENLLNDAQLIYKISKKNNTIYKKNFSVITSLGIDVDLIEIKDLTQVQYIQYKDKENYYVQINYPFNLEKKQFIKITKNINSSRRMLNKIFNNLLLLSLGGIILVILYAFTVSKSLLKPIMEITKKLSNMDENYLTQINKNSLPIEFYPLADSINSLTKKIQTFVKFKKELFIGSAHELKTPLAVMKLKSEVTLMKDRETKKYKDTLKLQIKQIDDMNKMISSILDIGRQEGAQFEKPIELDFIEFLKRKTNDYRMLSAEKSITITFYSNVNKYIRLIQPTLLIQILQNYVQNAIKFTPKNGNIAIRFEKAKNNITITVTDTGNGIDESIDLFAPFKRVGNASGAGLGLFLAQSAADALGAEISLKNRIDEETGCVAKIILPTLPSMESKK